MKFIVYSLLVLLHFYILIKDYSSLELINLIMKIKLIKI